MRLHTRILFLLIGAVLNAMPLSIATYYGNLLPYIDSYFHAHANDVTIAMNPIWTPSVFVCGFILGMIIGSPFEHRFGIHPCIAVGNVFTTVSVISGYFTMKEPLALTLVFGGLHGISVGFLYALIVKLLLQTLPNHGGMATGVMSIGPVFGALINVGLAFAVINPGNDKPDLEIGNTMYFSDPGLIDRVPRFFLVWGATIIAFSLVGEILLYIGSTEPVENNATQTTAWCPPSQAQRNNLTEGDRLQVVGANGNNDEQTPIVIGSAVYTGLEQEMCNRSPEICGSSSSSDGEIRNGARIGKTLLTVQSDASPREVIRSARFWFIWVAYICSNHTNFVHTFLYKQYGQRVIPDDSLLVTTGIVSSAGMMVVRPLVGVLSDSVGIRNTNVALNSASCLFMSLMVVSIHTCPWVYMVLVVIENMGVSPHTMLFSLITASEFGKTHCASNMGLIRSGNIPLVLLEPFIVEGMVRTIGWDWVFLTGSMASAIATVAIIALDWC